MSWFDKLGRPAPELFPLMQPHHGGASGGAQGSEREGLRSAPAHELPTEPVPVTPSASPEPSYDPSQPSQGPIAGIDLITFAAVSRRLMDTPASEHEHLLAAHGHTPDTWRTVNTAWIARLGQMPFLYETYVGAYRTC